MSKLKQADQSIIYLNGLLAACAWFNNKTNHGFTFLLEPFPKTKSLEESIAQYIDNRDYHGEEAVSALELKPLQDWKIFTRNALDMWLFQFRHEITIFDRLLVKNRIYCRIFLYLRKEMLTDFATRF